MKENIASNPARTTCLWAEGFSLLDSREWKCKARDKNQIYYRPVRELLLERKKIRSPILSNGKNHFAIRSINNPA